MANQTNRLGDVERDAITDAVQTFADKTPRMNTAERFTTAVRIAHRAIGCDERDLRVSELQEIELTVRLILARTGPGKADTLSLYDIEAHDIDMEIEAERRRRLAY